MAAPATEAGVQVKQWFNKPFGLRDKFRFMLQDIQCDLEEFRMLFDENVLKRCGVCGVGGGHKMDCYREYTKARKKQKD